MTYEAPYVQEIGNADDLTLGCLCSDAVDATGMHKMIDYRF